jgi:hypothetical protein
MPPRLLREEVVLKEARDVFKEEEVWPEEVDKRKRGED